MRDLIGDVVIHTNALKPELRQYHISNDHQFGDFLVRHAVLASASAPTYFPSFKCRYHNEDYHFVDGGVTLNNSAEYLYDSVRQKIGYEHEYITLSLGCGQLEEENQQPSDSLWYWATSYSNIQISAQMNDAH